MINGVIIKPLRTIPDERGRLMEILRCDDELFRGFGQIYLTSVYPGVVKAWHCHREQYDNFVVVRGMVKLALYDDRAGSATRGEVNEFFTGDHNRLLIQIPPGVYHGFKCIGEEEALVLNCPDKPYNYQDPDELRLPPHNSRIPYDWARKDG